MDIRKTLTIVLRLALSSNYRFIRGKKIFDSGYYLAGLNKNEVAGSSPAMDPLWDFLKMSGRDYMPMIEAAGGWCHIPSPHPLFDIAYYLIRYFPEGLDENPFIQYLRSGWAEGHRPGPYFDPVVYGERSGWSEVDGDPLTHFTHVGSEQGLSPGLNFDIDWYHDRNPVLAEVHKDIIKHYKLHGAPIDKSPLPVFDPGFYRKQLAAKQPTLVLPDPFAHFITTGSTDGLRPAEWFDTAAYLEVNGEECCREDALANYIHSGVHRGCMTDERVAALNHKPIISLLVPVYNPDSRELNNCIRSVLFQPYPHWELCLADDGSTREGVRDILRKWAAKDDRIKIRFLETNLGISGATNGAAELASGDYFGFLDNDDELSPDCLYRVALAINEHGADLVYSDEDLIGDDGTQLSIFRKPDYNSGLLLSHNYITHFVVVARPLFEKVGGFHSEFDGAQDFDLMLRLTEIAENVHHIPHVLYHWRASETSTSINHSQKNYANEAGRKALAQAVTRRGLAAEVEDTELNFFYRVKFSTAEDRQTAVFIIFTKEEPEDIGDTLRSLEETIPESCTVHFFHPESFGHESLLHGAVKNRGIAHPYMAKKGWCGAINDIAGETEEDRLVFALGDGGRFEPGWIEALVEYEQMTETGMVCGRVSYCGSDGPSYGLPDLQNSSSLYFYEFLTHCSRHLNGLHCPQKISCCGWESALIRRKLLVDLGGFNTKEFPHLFAMTDLSLRLVETGERSGILRTVVSIINQSPPSHYVLVMKSLPRKKRCFRNAGIIGC